MAASTHIYDRTRPNIDRVERILEQINKQSLHPQVASLQSVLQDFISGAPARNLVMAYDSSNKIIGAMTFVDNRDEQEIKALGVVHGENTARTLVRSLNHQKTLTVSANTPEHDLYDKLGFQHSEEIEEGEPSKMVKLGPKAKTAASGISQKARLFAKEAHEAVGQVRKYTSEPYIIHPDGVVALLVDNGVMTPEILAAAYLHDTVEDTQVTLEDIHREFGPEIAGLVEMLTDVAKPEDGNRATRMKINQDHNALASPDAQTIKVADIIHNVLDISINDPKWAPKYIAEKEQALKLLTKADQKILALAWATIEKLKEPTMVTPKTSSVEPPETAEISTHKIGEILRNAMAYERATKRLFRLQNGEAKPRSEREEANLATMIKHLEAYPINGEASDHLRAELLSIGRQLSRHNRSWLQKGSLPAWDRAGKKLMSLLSDELKSSIQTWSHTGGLKVATEMSLLFCTNSDCPDFEKRDHGNLTMGFSYGVKSDRHMIYCSTCQSRFSETKCTEFFGTKLSSSEIHDILHNAIEGKSIREIAEIMDLNKDTVNQALLKSKAICEDYIKNKEHTKVTTEMLTDMDLQNKHRDKLHDFIKEVVIPEINGSDDEEEKSEEEDSETKKANLKIVGIIKASRIFKH